MTLENLGYSTGDIILPGLDILITLPSNRYFRDDGVVRDLDGHTEEVLKELGKKNTYTRYQIPTFGSCIGEPIDIGGVETKLSVIFYLDLLPIDLVFTKGEESTHALIFLNQERYLLELLRHLRFSIDPFRVFKDDESIAHLGGLLSLYRAKIPFGLGRPDAFYNDRIAHIHEAMMRSRV